MRAWFPDGHGLRDEDWTRRHRLLTLLLALSVVALSVSGFLRDGSDAAWMLAVALILPCVVGAVLLRRRRLPSILVAVGATVACGGFVNVSQGMNESHFVFFISVAA